MKWKLFLSRMRFLLWLLLFTAALGCLAASGAGMAADAYFTDKTGISIQGCYLEGKQAVKDTKRSDFKRGATTRLYAEDGGLLADLSKEKESSYLRYDAIPKWAVDAYVAVEDRSFWENDGIDLKGIFRVAVGYVRSGGKEEHGASTVTQQLARQRYLTLDRTLKRKVSEIGAAVLLTKKYSKEEIMEFYVNYICYANGIYGLQDAAVRYFGKNAKDLTLSETAYLCAIPNWPEKFNPLKDPKAAVPRRNKILGDMLELGMISKKEHDAAVNEKVVIAKSKKKKKRDYEATYAIHCAKEFFMERARFQFQYAWSDMDEYHAYQAAYEEAYAAAGEELKSGGYEIQTSLDASVQKIAQKSLSEALAGQQDRLEDGSFKVQGAMAVIDNESQLVTAVVGGREKPDGMFSFNRAFQGYAQPGSSIKPLAVYAPAMESVDEDEADENGKTANSYSPDSILYNISISVAKKAEEGEISGLSGTPVALRGAVERSLNGCAYWLLNDIGISRGLSPLADMGFQKIAPSDYTLSAALGGLTYGTTPVEMAGAYAALANSGMHKKPTCLVSIVDAEGREIYKSPKKKRIYEKDAADAMTDVMKGVLRSGTAASIGWYQLQDTEAAGKTGTTNDNKAGWFCGYTPYYSIAVWVGCDVPEEVPGLMGSNYPLAAWGMAMGELIKDKPVENLAEMPEMEDRIPGCICSLKCHPWSVNADCKACAGAESSGLSHICLGAESPCVCALHCEGDSIYEGCTVCVADPSQCVGVTADTPCSCQTPCAGIINPSCQRCLKNPALCAIAAPPCICAGYCPEYGKNLDCPLCAINQNECMGQHMTQ